jgi:K+-transporting ATPase ATPase C chain
MRKQLAPAIVILLVLTVVLGLVYPLAVTAIAQAAFHGGANGSIVEVDGSAVGSSLIGQRFSEPSYFHPRPSAAGEEGYDAQASGASNLGPTNPDLLDAVDERAAAYRAENGLAATDEVPVDAVTASGSGLDPHISVANARLQAPRVAVARAMDVDEVLALVEQHTENRSLGIFGENGVNVLELNLAVDERSS